MQFSLSLSLNLRSDLVQHLYCSHDSLKAGLQPGSKCNRGERGTIWNEIHHLGQRWVTWAEEDEPHAHLSRRNAVSQGGLLTRSAHPNAVRRKSLKIGRYRSKGTITLSARDTVPVSLSRDLESCTSAFLRSFRCSISSRERERELFLFFCV